MFVEQGELLFDLRGLRPDAAVDEPLLVIGEVHEAGEILPQLDGINDGERNFSRRRNGEQAEDDGVERGDDFRATGVLGLEQDRAFARERERERQVKAARAGQREFGIGGDVAGEFGGVHSEASERGGVGEGFGRRPVFPSRRLPVGENFCGGRDDGGDGLVERLRARVPFGQERVPLRVALGVQLRFLGGEGCGEFLVAFGGEAFDFVEALPVFEFQDFQAGVAAVLVSAEDARGLCINLLAPRDARTGDFALGLAPLPVEMGGGGLVLVPDAREFGGVMGFVALETRGVKMACAAQRGGELASGGRGESLADEMEEERCGGERERRNCGLNWRDCPPAEVAQHRDERGVDGEDERDQNPERQAAENQRQRRVAEASEAGLELVECVTEVGEEGVVVVLRIGRGGLGRRGEETPEFSVATEGAAGFGFENGERAIFLREQLREVGMVFHGLLERGVAGVVGGEELVLNLDVAAGRLLLDFSHAVLASGGAGAGDA